MITDNNSSVTTSEDNASEVMQQIDLESQLGDTIRDKDSMITLFVDMDSILIGYEPCG